MVKKKRIKNKAKPVERTYPRFIFSNRKTQKILVILLLFITPLIVFQLWDVYSHAKYITFQIIVLFLFFLLLTEDSRESIIKFNSHPLNLPVLLYLGASFISLFFAVNPLKGADYFLRNFACVLFFLVICKLFKGINDPSKGVLSLFFSCLIIAVFGIYQFIDLNLQQSEHAFYLYYGSLFANPNYAGQFVSIALPLTIFCIYLFRRRPLTIVLIILCALIMFFYLILTFARGAWLSLIFGIFVVICTGFYLKLVNTHGSKGKRIFWIVFSCLISIIFLIILISWITDFSIYSVDFILKRGVEVESTPYGFIQSRLLLWSGCLDLIKQNFPFGIGIGNFEFEIPKYQKFFPNNGKFQYAHGDFLQKTCEEGFLGLFVFLWLLAAIFKSLYFAIIKTRGQRRILFISLLGSVSTMCFFALLDFPFYEPAPLLVFWFCAGITASQLSNSSQNPELEKSRYYHFKLPAFAILLFALIFLMVFGIYLFNFVGGGYFFQRAKQAKYIQDVVKDLNKSLDLWDHEYQTHFKLSEAYYFQNNYQRAERELKAALKLNPYHWPSLGNIGLLYMNLYESKKNHPEREKFLEKSYNYIKESNKMNPIFNLYNLALVYYYKKDYEQAIRCFRSEVVYFPNNLDAYFWCGRCYLLTGDLDNAEKFYKKAVELNPKNFNPLFALSETLMANKKYEEAYDTIMKAIDVSPQSYQAKKLREDLIRILMNRR